MAFGSPAADAGIDWQRGYRFLHAELTALAPPPVEGCEVVDMLAQVWALDGADAWVLLHLELPPVHDPEFPKRMFRYFCAVSARFDRYDSEHIYILPILLDGDRRWRPNEYHEDLFGTITRFRYPLLKLTDWQDRISELEASPLPFALIVQAHLDAQNTVKSPHLRLEAKLRLMQRLSAGKYTDVQAIEVMRMLNALLVLPPELEARTTRGDQ